MLPEFLVLEIIAELKDNHRLAQYGGYVVCHVKTKENIFSKIEQNP